MVPDPGFRVLHRNGLFGLGVKVAVIDSGIAIGSMVRRAMREPNLRDFVEPGGKCDDPFGHGTTVASVVKRYAPGVELVAAKIGAEADALNSARLVQALDWAYHQGAHVVNLSIGFPVTRACYEGKCAVCRTVNALADRGVIVVAAAGNKQDTLHGHKMKALQHIRCPSCADGVVAVGAINHLGEIADYSVKAIPGRSKPDLLAPGTVRFQNGQEDQTGTSFAAPVVAAAVAALGPQIGFLRAVEILKQTAHQIDGRGYPTGYGVIDLERAWEVVAGAGIASGAEGSQPS